MNYIEYPTYKGTEISICQTEMEEPRARLASELMRHLAIVACMPDGESSDGRQKFRLMTEPEVVERAVGIAQHAWNAYRIKGWILDVPLPRVDLEKVTK